MKICNDCKKCKITDDCPYYELPKMECSYKTKDREYYEHVKSM